MSQLIFTGAFSDTYIISDSVILYGSYNQDKYKYIRGILRKDSTKDVLYVETGYIPDDEKDLYYDCNIILDLYTSEKPGDNHQYITESKAYTIRRHFINYMDNLHNLVDGHPDKVEKLKEKKVDKVELGQYHKYAEFSKIDDYVLGKNNSVIPPETFNTDSLSSMISSITHEPNMFNAAESLRGLVPHINLDNGSSNSVIPHLENIRKEEKSFSDKFKETLGLKKPTPDKIVSLVSKKEKNKQIEILPMNVVRLKK